MERKTKTKEEDFRIGDRVVLNRKPFVGQGATIMLKRDGMVSVDLGYGYARPWISVHDLLHEVKQ